MLSLSKKDIAQKLSSFIWNFKVGENIVYNLKILFDLYKSKQEVVKNKKTFNKPIVVILVSIIEAIFYDFICYLSESTRHFPNHSISNETREYIKKKINRDKVPYGPDGYLRIKNYSFTELVGVLEESEILGDVDSDIYDRLSRANYLRNRIHIFNWFGNFELDENVVFTEKRVQAVEKLLVDILTILEKRYPRPFSKEHHSRQIIAWEELMEG